MIYNKSVPKGFRHIWKYKGKWDEKKVRKGLWRFTFKASKGKRSSRIGSFGKGTKGAWRINAIQYILKTGKGAYQTKMVGTKQPLKFYVKNKNKRYR